MAFKDNNIMNKLHICDMKFGLLVIYLTMHLSVSQDCTLPEELWGTWTSTNLETVVISGSSPSLSFTKTFIGQSGSVNELDCRFTSGKQYILQSKSTIPTFSLTNPIYMWMCIDLRRASAYSYYYYLNSPTEPGFDNYRLVGLPDGSVTAADVCTETIDVAEFNTMIKDGFETDAVNNVMCADPLLGSYNYTFTDSTGTSCENTGAFINSCDNSNRTQITVNNTGCQSIDPFYSSGGEVGCIANVYDTSADVYYISLYNLDTSPSTTFICIAVSQASNGTVFLSMLQSDCVAGQSPTTLPSGGATMILSASCLLDTETKKKNWTWLYIFLPCLILLIIFILACIFLFWWLKKREIRIARCKLPLVSADHPLGEVSLKLDAPASLGLQNGYFDRKRDLLEKPSRKKNDEGGDDILGEQSLNLDLAAQTWKKFEVNGIRKKQPYIDRNFSEAAVTGSNDSTPNGSARTSKVRNTISGRFKSKTKNFLTTRMASNSFKERVKTRNSISYDRSTKASSTRGLNLSIRKTSNGVMPVPLKRSKSTVLSRQTSKIETRSVSNAGSRPGSRASSRRGSIDNLVISRNSRLPRSKTLMLAKSLEDKGPEIYTMPEEYATEGGPNEVVPKRPKPMADNTLRDSYQSINKRSKSQLALKKPGASRGPWR